MREIEKEDANVKCTVFFKDRRQSSEMLIQWTFLMNGLVKYLYENFGDEWEYCEPFWADTLKNAYGRIINTEETRSKIDIKLVPNDFDLIILDNCNIQCELWLKSQDRPNIYRITKKELLQTFVREMYDLHGNDWSYFETFFEDSGDYAYGPFWNDKHRRENQYVTFQQLKGSRYKLNREKWRREKLEQVERFYILSFIDGEFIKIGHTFRNIEHRLYNYLFLGAIAELNFYKNKVIDFENSYLLTTDITLFETRQKKRFSFERKSKIKFKTYRLNRKDIPGPSTEILNCSALPLLLDELKESCVTNKNWHLQTLAEYTGFADALMMKDYNLTRGIISNPVHFFRSRSNPKLYLNTNNRIEQIPIAVTEEMWSWLKNNPDEEIRIAFSKLENLDGEFSGCPVVTNSGDEADMFYGTSSVGYLSFDIETDCFVVHEKGKIDRI